MFAARDQENLVHAHQTAGAAKPLNQSLRQAPPKTPGNKVPKIPFKLPLNDENVNGGIPPFKGGLKSIGKGNENAATGKKAGLGNQNAFTTPVAQKNRAPLGMKTTNAKAKGFQTPALPKDRGLGERNQKSVSARKAKPKVSHAEMTKIDVLGDTEAEERDIEYMPPKVQDLPDIPDDLPPLDYSILKDCNPLFAALHRPNLEGLSILERQERDRSEKDDRNMRRGEALILRDIEAMPIPCIHTPDCPGDTCKDTAQRVKAAKAKYQKTMAAIDAEEVPAWRKVLGKEGRTPMLGGILPGKARATVAKSSKKAPAPSTKPLAPSARAHLMNANLATRPKKAPGPSNPSPMRHNAALAASRTTVGYSKGRKTSAALHRSVMPGKENERKTADAKLAPAEYVARYGMPNVGTEMWMQCKQAGYFEGEEERLSAKEIWGFDAENDCLRDAAAEEDFVLTLQD